MKCKILITSTPAAFHGAYKWCHLLVAKTVWAFGKAGGEYPKHYIYSRMQHEQDTKDEVWAKHFILAHVWMGGCRDTSAESIVPLLRSRAYMLWGFFCTCALFISCYHPLLLWPICAVTNDEAYKTIQVFLNSSSGKRIEQE